MEPVATTTAGRVRGRADRGALAFLGVPFAAPPFGARRLLAPAPPEPWDGVRDAVAYGPTAQRPDDEIAGGIPEPSIAGEDILTANVFTPEIGDARLPVLVWIHGGGFVAGSPASPWYHGARFARDGVVVVTIGYRLGAEGFLALEGAPANRAVLDWLAALEWVQDNIAAFGGDPARVTVAGQSAGGAACTALLSIPRARSLFRGVISMSGVSHTVPLDRARQAAARIAAELGVAPTRDAVAALPPTALHRAQRVLQPREAGLPTDGDIAASQLPFAPIVDGELIAHKPLKAIAGGEGGDIDVVVGATRHEANATARERAGAIGEDHLTPILAAMGFQAEAYRAHHAALPPPAVLGQAITDQMFRSRVQRFAEARAAGGASGRDFVYEFRWESQARDGLGAVHCIDIPFAFDNLDVDGVTPVTGPEPPQALADLMHSAWVRFVTDGDPGWPAHDPERRATMLFGVESGPAEDPLRDERLLWPR